MVCVLALQRINVNTLYSLYSAEQHHESMFPYTRERSSFSLRLLSATKVGVQARAV